MKRERGRSGLGDVHVTLDRGRQGDRHAEAAYQAMAPVYEDFTAHHDYRLWIGMLMELGQAHGLSGNAALDVACGTGKSFMPLLERGWTVAACDISPSMADLARLKVGPDVRIEIADMRDMPVFGSFDLVLCVDDAVNYLHSALELERALVRMAANMAPDGLLIFDSNTLNTYRTFFAEHIEIESNGCRMIWKGQSGGHVEPGEISQATFEVRPVVAGSGISIPPELHRQRHHPEAEVRATIAAAGLELCGLYGHRRDAIPRQPMNEEKHTKAIYVARRARGSTAHCLTTR